MHLYFTVCLFARRIHADSARGCSRVLGSWYERTFFQVIWLPLLVHTSRT